MQYPQYTSYELGFSNCYSIGWPDTVQGLLALKNQVIIATLSNGNVRLLVDMVMFIFYSHP